MEVGDKIYCHKTGYFNGSTEDKDIFAIKGNTYTITEVRGGDFMILNERGNDDHTWSFCDEFYEFFVLKEEIQPPKTFSKFKFS